jgi:arabinogalactan oligomer / maltooligosaccharide transport system permease protein
MATTDELAATTAVTPRRGPIETLKRGYHRWWFAYAMLLPVIVVMAVLVLYPLVRGILLSFTDANRFTIGNAQFPPSYQYVGFSNYLDTITGAAFRRVAGFTVVWTFVNVFFHFTIGLGLAVMLNRTIKFRGIYRMLIMVPWAVPSFISAFAWKFLFNNPYGFFDQSLRAIGIDGPAWLGDPFWAKVSVIMANTWLGIPFMMVALLGGLQALDQDLLDASAVDGATPWQRFWTVTLPSLRPVAATVILLGIIWTFNMFNIIFLITQGGPGNATQILSTFAYRYAFDNQLFGIASTYGVVILSLLLVFAQGYRRLVTRLGEETWA